MTVQPAVLPAFSIVSVLVFAAAVISIRWGGWLGWTLGIIAVLAAIAGFTTIGFAFWGRYAGFPWGFGS